MSATAADLLAAEQVSASLACLGETPGEVHFHLARAGVRGVRGATTILNPVVRFLSRRQDLSSSMEVPLGRAWIKLPTPGGDLAVPLPPAVGSFLERFHAGLYPELAAG